MRTVCLGGAVARMEKDDFPDPIPEPEEESEESEVEEEVEEGPADGICPDHPPRGEACPRGDACPWYHIKICVPFQKGQ